jgi:hypothetical protein
MSATMTIGDRSFHEGQRVRTPRGEGTIIGLDPFADAEIGVRLGGEPLVWFSFREIDQVHMLTCEACGRDAGFLANGIGTCCWGKDE